MWNFWTENSEVSIKSFVRWFTFPNLLSHECCPKQRHKETFKEVRQGWLDQYNYWWTSLFLKAFVRDRQWHNTYLYLLIQIFLVIWFERYGSDLRRTMVNRLMSSICWSMIALVLIPQSIDVIRYLYGPLPHALCRANLLSKNFITMMTLLFYDASMVMKYVSIFCLKNPFGFRDEFWYLLCNIWIVLFAFISQLIGELLPGNHKLWCRKSW